MREELELINKICRTCLKMNSEQAYSIYDEIQLPIENSIEKGETKKISICDLLVEISAIQVI